MAAYTTAISTEITNVEESLKVMQAKSGLKPMATAIGIFYALEFANTDLEYFQGEAVISAPNATYRLTEDGWQRETEQSFVLVKSAVEASALDMFVQAKNDGYIVLFYPKSELEVIATAYLIAKKRYLSR